MPAEPRRAKTNLAVTFVAVIFGARLIRAFLNPRPGKAAVTGETDAAKGRPARNRIWAVFLTMAVAALLGASFARIFGFGFRPEPPRTIDGLGRLESLRLPSNMRRLKDIKSFVIRFELVDDYARAIVNNNTVLMTNYIIPTSEATGDLFYEVRNRARAKKLAEQVAHRRNPAGRDRDTAASRDVAQFLTLGTNTIVLEVENSAWGACFGRFDILVNGQSLEHFPRTLPANSRADSATINKAMLKRFVEAALSEKAHGALAVSEQDDAICERRVLSFDVLE